MTALSADRATTVTEGGVLVSYPVEESTTIYAGSLVCINAAGYAIPGADASGNKFVGVATEKVDNSAGADGAKSVEVRIGCVAHFVNSDLVLTDIQEVCAVMDDQTVEQVETNTNNIKCGIYLGDDPTTAEARVLLNAGYAHADSSDA